MFFSNPFAELTELLPPLAMQTYIVLMALAVAGGTIADMIHKGSATYFAQDWAKKKAIATKRLSGLDLTGMALGTLLKEIATSGEFCNQKRRISHLFMFYGFVTYLVTTVLMVFAYLTGETPPLVALLWHIGALSVAIGGYWFFFFLRVDVAQERQSPFDLKWADIFIVTLLGSVTFGLLWSIFQALGFGVTALVLFALYVLFSTLLFGSVRWSKFAHMFFKPVAAFQKRVENADGSSDLPAPTEGSNIRMG
jgi:hypothetical protein